MMFSLKNGKGEGSERNRIVTCMVLTATAKDRFFAAMDFVGSIRHPQVRSIRKNKLNMGTHGKIPLRVKDDIEDVSSEFGNGDKGCTFWMKRPELYCSRI
ncbi:hypothetical protein TNCV_152811 [Trichonephila clavipes]|nr:hypothetical protein TNCV_152811 [Trichonephila clavipes]